MPNREGTSNGTGLSEPSDEIDVTAYEYPKATDAETLFTFIEKASYDILLAACIQNPSIFLELLEDLRDKRHDLISNYFLFQEKRNRYSPLLWIARHQPQFADEFLNTVEALFSESEELFENIILAYTSEKLNVLSLLAFAKVDNQAQQDSVSAQFERIARWISSFPSEARIAFLTNKLNQGFSVIDILARQNPALLAQHLPLLLEGLEKEACAEILLQTSDLLHFVRDSQDEEAFFTVLKEALSCMGIEQQINFSKCLSEGLALNIHESDPCDLCDLWMISAHYLPSKYFKRLVDGSGKEKLNDALERWSREGYEDDVNALLIAVLRGDKEIIETIVNCIKDLPQPNISIFYQRVMRANLKLIECPVPGIGERGIDLMRFGKNLLHALILNAPDALSIVFPEVIQYAPRTLVSELMSPTPYRTSWPWQSGYHRNRYVFYCLYNAWVAKKINDEQVKEFLECLSRIPTARLPALEGYRGNQDVGGAEHSRNFLHIFLRFPADTQVNSTLFTWCMLKTYNGGWAKSILSVVRSELTLKQQQDLFLSLESEAPFARDKCERLNIILTEMRRLDLTKAPQYGFYFSKLLYHVLRVCSHQRIRDHLTELGELGGSIQEDVCLARFGSESNQTDLLTMALTHAPDHLLNLLQVASQLPEQARIKIFSFSE